MSAYSSLKEMYKDTTQIIQGKDTAGKTVYLLKQFCFFAVCLLYLIEKCGFREVILSYVNIEITLPQIIQFLFRKQKSQVRQTVATLTDAV